MSGEQFHSAGDEVLSHLSIPQGAGCDLVRAFLSRDVLEDRKWLEKWFQSRIEKHFAGSLSGPDSILSFDHPSDQVEEAPLAPPIKLKSVQAHYFRGFREGLDRVEMGGNLVVIQGRNSTGKTSLAEALEWLLSGSLSRRESSNIGDTSELEHCITNVFRPPNEDTWVSAEFVSYSSESDADTFTLRRVLQEDYGATAKATCRSVLYLNDKKLSPGEESQVLDKLFAGVPPLLMQHTLRDFVHGAPERRRNYFERLLRLDEVTELIRLAVISNDRANDFPSPSGGEYLRLWNQLGSILENNSSH